MFVLIPRISNGIGLIQSIISTGLFLVGQFRLATLAVAEADSGVRSAHIRSSCHLFPISTTPVYESITGSIFGGGGRSCLQFSLLRPT